MHHNLDIHPIPENALYINDLRFASIACEPQYRCEDDKYSGEDKDNVRVYVPMDLNAENILYQLKSLFEMLGSPSWDNECAYSLETGKIVAQLEIYDQVWAARGHHDKASYKPSVIHSREGIELAKKIIAYLKEKDGTADSFPYEVIDELREEFGV